MNRTGYDENMISCYSYGDCCFFFKKTVWNSSFRGDISRGL